MVYFLLRAGGAKSIKDRRGVAMCVGVRGDEEAWGVGETRAKSWG
jgi:hypothetical protein